MFSQGVEFFNRKLNNLCMDWLSDNIFSVRGIGLRGADPQYHQTFTPSPPCRYPRNSCRCAKLEAPGQSFRRGMVPLENNSTRVRVKGSHLLSATNDNDQNFKGICIVACINAASINTFSLVWTDFKQLGDRWNPRDNCFARGWYQVQTHRIVETTCFLTSNQCTRAGVGHGPGSGGERPVLCC